MEKCVLLPQHVYCHRLITHCSHFLLNLQLPTGFVLVGQKHNNNNSNNRPSRPINLVLLDVKLCQGMSLIIIIIIIIIIISLIRTNAA